MKHLFRGEWISSQQLSSMITYLPSVIEEDLRLGPPKTSLVINAISKLMDSIDFNQLLEQLISMGLPKWKGLDFITTIKKELTLDALWLKVQRELPNPLNQWVVMNDPSNLEERIEEAQVPYGVLMHIGAGNVIALSVLSVLEGLLSGNINLLKIPSYEGDVSLRLLKQLADIEPKLKPYIYAFHISSKDKNKISSLLQVVDALVVWGSDSTIKSLRTMVPPTIPIIEWGHHLSFAYLVPNKSMDADLEHLAKDLCLNNQLYCSSPQCLFVETNKPLEKDFLATIGHKLLNHIKTYATDYPNPSIPLPSIAEITWQKQLVAMEELLGKQKLLDKGDASVLIDYTPSLKASPMYRNIWLMPITREQVFSILRRHKGHLQTAGLSCPEQDYDLLCRLFYQSGVTRITDFNHMSKTYIGEPHDGKVPLNLYTKTVSRRRVN